MMRAFKKMPVPMIVPTTIDVAPIKFNPRTSALLSVSMMSFSDFSTQMGLNRRVNECCSRDGCGRECQPEAPRSLMLQFVRMAEEKHDLRMERAIQEFQEYLSDLLPPLVVS